MKLVILVISVFSFLLVFPLSTSVAHDGATGIVKERMEAMKDISSRMKSIAKMIKGEEPLNAARLSLMATEIENHGGEAMIAKFPKGSIHGPSEAVPAIWEDWNEFQKLAFELSRKSKALATEITTNPNQLPVDAFKVLAKNCKSCHDDFRKKK